MSPGRLVGTRRAFNPARRGLEFVSLRKRAKVREMSAREFFQAEAKLRVRQAIERVEQQTSAEIVVAVRKRAGGYLAADLAWGAVAGLSCLAFLIYSPLPFATAWIPVDVALAFAAGALFSWQTPTVRRLFCSARSREQNVQRAALEVFHRDKLSRTQGRTALLIVVGVFERRAAVIGDLGIDPEAMGSAVQQAVEGVQGSVRGLFPRLETFARAVEALGPALSTALPRQADDVNELPDELEAS